jgi:hypothetical protein
MNKVKSVLFASLSLALISISTGPAAFADTEGNNSSGETDQAPDEYSAGNCQRGSESNLVFTGYDYVWTGSGFRQTGDHEL